MTTLQELMNFLRKQQDPSEIEAAREQAFLRWYQSMAGKHNLNPNPEGQYYDYRAAFVGGASPDETGHWPSTYKLPGHPNMAVGGFNVQTGERVPGTKRASLRELIDLGWDAETAARLLAASKE